MPLGSAPLTRRPLIVAFPLRVLFFFGPQNRLACEVCGSCFSTQAALSSHRWAAHRLRSEVGLWAPGSYCRACGTDFLTRRRLIKHLRAANTGCLAKLKALFPPLSPRALAAAESAGRLARSSHEALVGIPCTRVIHVHDSE